MPAFLVIQLGNATKEALLEGKQGVFVRGVIAVDKDAAIDQFANELGEAGRYAAIPAAQLSTSIVEHSSSLNITPET